MQIKIYAVTLYIFSNGENWQVASGIMKTKFKRDKETNK